MPQQTTQQTREMKECADACTNARRVVEQTLAYCLEQGGDHAQPRHVQLMRDCIDICNLCATTCDRGSENCVTVCTSCVEIANRCAEDCASFKGDSQMETCAQACRDAAKAAKTVR